MALPAQNDITNCCQRVSPCDALCMLENMEISLAMGKEITSYSIGEEKFAFKKPSLAEIRTLINIYTKRCNLAHGRPSRRRLRGVCFVHGDPICNRCQISSCGGC